jgi:hypothetical protein
MDSIINSLKELSLQSDDTDIDQLCQQINSCVINGEVNITNLINEFARLEVEEGIIFDPRILNCIKALLLKPKCENKIKISKKDKYYTCAMYVKRDLNITVEKSDIFNIKI